MPDFGKLRRRLPVGLKVLVAVLAAPPEIRQIFVEAETRVREAVAKLDRESPGWRTRTFDGPDSMHGIFNFAEEIARERGKVDEIKEWFAKILKDAKGES